MLRPIPIVCVVLAIGLLYAAVFVNNTPFQCMASFLLGVGVGGLPSLISGRTSAAKRPAVAATQAKTSSVDLEDLELRCKVRGDFETAGLIDRLQALAGRLRDCEAAAGADSVDLTMKMRKMYDNAAAFCGRALALHLARREMVTDDAKQKVDDQRKALLDEITAAVGAIESGVDRLRVAAATAGDADRKEELSDLNADLDRRLEVARKVEQRMADIEAQARGDYSKAAAFVEGNHEGHEGARRPE